MQLLPKIILNYTDGVNYSNGETQLEKFITWTIRPLEKRIEKIFTKLLEGRGIIVNGLTFGDCDDRAGFILRQKQEGYTRFIVIDDEALEYQQRYKEIGYNRIIGTNPYRCLDMMDYECIKFN